MERLQNSHFETNKKNSIKSKKEKDCPEPNKQKINKL